MKGNIINMDGNNMFHIPVYSSAFAASICILLAGTDSPLSYSSVMGLSGLAFRFDRRKQAEPPDLLRPYEDRIYRAIGVKQATEDGSAPADRIAASLASNIPVLFFDGGWRLLFKDSDPFPDRAEFRFFDRLTPAEPPEQALMETLSLCVRSRTDQVAGDYEAMLDWVSALQTGANSPSENTFLLKRLLDSRRAAAAYLEQGSYLLEGTKAMLLSDSAKLYQMVCSLLENSLKQKDRDDQRLASRIQKILAAEKEVEYNFRFILER